MAVVPQGEDAVFPLRVDEAVMLGRYPHLGAFAAPRETDRSAVRDALLRCDVAHLAGRTIDSLSGGEWQRVRVARALAQDPRILVLDEPTTSLDVRHEMELFELVRRLMDQGLAGLVVTHHINLAARFADRMVLLSGGRVAADGTPAAVLRARRAARGLRVAGGRHRVVRRLPPGGAPPAARGRPGLTPSARAVDPAYLSGIVPTPPGSP